jgi:hypothetical protein
LHTYNALLPIGFDSVCEAQRESFLAIVSGGLVVNTETLVAHFRVRFRARIRARFAFVAEYEVRG